MSAFCTLLGDILVWKCIQKSTLKRTDPADQETQRTRTNIFLIAHTFETPILYYPEDTPDASLAIERCSESGMHAEMSRVPITTRTLQMPHATVHSSDVAEA